MTIALTGGGSVADKSETMHLTIFRNPHGRLPILVDFVTEVTRSRGLVVLASAMIENRNLERLDISHAGHNVDLR